MCSILFCNDFIFIFDKDNDRDNVHRSMDDNNDEEDDATISDRSSKSSSPMKQTIALQWDYRVSSNIVLRSLSEYYNIVLYNLDEFNR